MDKRNVHKRKRLFKENRGIFKNLDLLGINDILKHIREDRFYIEERFKTMRNKLKNFIDQITNIFNLDYFSDRFFTSILNIINIVLDKTYQFELDIAGVKKMVFKLYPIRKLLSEHSKVIDILSRY
ncbi:MAG: hypothetical protein ACTSRG_12690 [Candidatus Helarchaeota archaeon]